MKRSRFVRPETATLPLSDGDWIVVKARLNVGELRDEYASRFEFVNGEPRLRLGDVGFTRVIAYLLDWSLEPKIRELAPADLRLVLRNLDPDDFAEIQQAIEDHIDATDVAREAEKKTLTGAAPSAPTSPSPDAAAGATSGSASLTPMSMASS